MHKRPFLQEILQEEFTPPVVSSVDQSNMGLLVVEGAEIERWMAAQDSVVKIDGTDARESAASTSAIDTAYAYQNGAPKYHNTPNERRTAALHALVK